MNNPTVQWREPGDVTAVLEVPAAGVFLGVDARVGPVLLPAVGPRVTRIGVVGDWRIAALLAYRLLGAGCLLTLADRRTRPLAAPARGRRHPGDGRPQRHGVAAAGRGCGAPARHRPGGPPEPAAGTGRRARSSTSSSRCRPAGRTGRRWTPCWSPGAATGGAGPVAGARRRPVTGRDRPRPARAAGPAARGGGDRRSGRRRTLPAARPVTPVTTNGTLAGTRAGVPFVGSRSAASSERGAMVPPFQTSSSSTSAVDQDGAAAGPDVRRTGDRTPHARRLAGPRQAPAARATPPPPAIAPAPAPAIGGR